MRMLVKYQGNGNYFFSDSSGRICTIGFFSCWYMGSGIIWFFAILIGGILSSYVSALFLVAFADLVQNSQYIKEAMEMKNVKVAAAEEKGDKAN